MSERRIEYFGDRASGRRWPLKGWPWIAAALVVLAVGGFSLYHNAHPAAGKFGATNWVAVRPMTLEIQLHQQGELQPVNSTSISCPVQGQSTIQQIVPEGSYVKKGELLVVLDPTEHQTQMQQADLELEKADADVKWSLEQKSIEAVEEKADLDAAESDLSLAKLDLRQYMEGDYPAALNDAKRKLEMAEISLKRKQEDLATTRRSMERDFVTMSEVQKAELEAVTASNEREKAASDLKVLVEYKHAKDRAEKENKVSQAEKKVARTRTENASNMAQKESDFNTKQRQFVMRKAAAAAAKEAFEQCRIVAPEDGLVLYPNNYDPNENLHAGSRVMQGQILVQLPDTARMKAVIKVPEARAANLRARAKGSIRASVSVVGMSEPIAATLSLVGSVPDMTNRFWNPDLKDYSVDFELDHTPANSRPGASASVDVYLDRLPDTLAVPVVCIYSSGREHYVFLRDDQRPQPRRVALGAANDTMVQITSGLSPGDQVLMLEAGQGRELLDLANIKPAPAATQSDQTLSDPKVPAQKVG